MCTQVYTLGGLELARVTVVDTEGETVYESLVQPFNSIVDYNTRYVSQSAALCQVVGISFSVTRQGFSDLLSILRGIQPDDKGTLQMLNSLSVHHTFKLTGDVL